MNTDMIAYYKARANEYEKIYSKPERQEDLLTATRMLQTIFAGKEVFEIACGTGYWTERIAATAYAVTATDINDTVISIAKLKTGISNVSFDVADMFNIALNNKYESLFAGFIWSHIKIKELEKFVDTINGFVKPGSSIVIMDNNYVEGSSLPIANTDTDGNTYQERKLTDGSLHSVLKNFPSEDSIREILKNRSAEIKFTSLKYFWILEYKSL